MKLHLVFIFSLLTASCDSPQTGIEFIYSKQLRKDTQIKLNNNAEIQTTRYEYFLVNKPPKNNQKKYNSINTHFKDYYSENIDLISQYNLFVVSYYQVSRETPIGFIEDPGGGITLNSIDDHTEDYICSFSIKNQFIGSKNSLILSNDCSPKRE
ncbi:MAG: hypothetical protein HY842_19305 [Bacteroidetes bacterium]|nr:hypothetical protein [Bacteroidota bacterium]